MSRKRWSRGRYAVCHLRFYRCPLAEGGSRFFLCIFQGHSGDAVKDLEAKLKYINETVPTNPQNIMGRSALRELILACS